MRYLIAILLIVCPLKSFSAADEGSKDLLHIQRVLMITGADWAKAIVDGEEEEPTDFDLLNTHHRIFNYNLELLNGLRVETLVLDIQRDKNKAIFLLPRKGSLQEHGSLQLVFGADINKTGAFGVVCRLVAKAASEFRKRYGLEIFKLDRNPFDSDVDASETMTFAKLEINPELENRQIADFLIMLSAQSCNDLLSNALKK